MMSIVIPACNEANYIGDCLTSLVSQADPGGPVQVIVAANNCSDQTAYVAERFHEAFAKRGWRLQVLTLAGGGKIGALNAADDAALYDMRMYIDADVVLSPNLLADAAKALARDGPIFVAGKVAIPKARSWISRRYARFWLKLPFHVNGVPGCGAFAVNGAGRKRWTLFPDVISDDTFARLNFLDHEMVGLPSTYDWPITEGFAPLVRVRRRQNAGVQEIKERYPELAAHATPTAPDRVEKLALLKRDPVGFLIYACVSLAVLMPIFRNRHDWERGR